jgi:hypothetical protein
LAIGTPDDITNLFKQYESMGADQMMTWVQFGGLPHEKITKSMQLLADQVLPKFGAQKLVTA